MSGRKQNPPGGSGSFAGNDRFQIERTLGEGSMGSVFLAYDRERRTQVALKTLRRVDSSGIARFKREFRALADLRHPHLVQLYDLFAEGDEWFFTMEYVDGEPLLHTMLGAELAQMAELAAGASQGTRKLGGASTTSPDEVRLSSPLQDPEALRRVMAQVAQGLSYAHGAGRLHRDLKPDNVLVSPEGRAVVLDFGIALQLADEGHRTMEVGVMGTPAYMSPEQAAGQEVSEATDWYAFGVILYQALTGTVPFDGNALDVLRIKQIKDPLAPSKLVTGVPEDLEMLCMALLQRDPLLRPSGFEVLGALAPERLSQGIVAAPPVVELGKGELVGRDAELRELSRAFSATDSGRPVIALVHGGTGIGKTALIDRFVADLGVEGRATILSGRCYERELMPLKAFDGVVDSLARHLRRVPVVSAADSMPRDVRSLVRLFPVLERVPVITQVVRRVPPPQQPDALRRSALGALKALLRRLAEQQPLVIVVDDLQWGDVDSARFIASLVTGNSCPAALLVFAYRTGDVQGSPCLRTLFDQTRDNPQLDIRNINLPPLSDPDMRLLAERFTQEQRALTSAELDALLHEAKGNPYVMKEALFRLDHEHGVDEGGGSLEAALSARTAALSPATLRVLKLIAVSGRPMSETLLAKVADQEATVLQESLRRLRDEKLIRGVGTVDAQAVDTYHEGVRRTVLAGMEETEAQGFHRRIADAIERMGAHDLQALTEHLIGAQEHKRASTYAIRAAVQASHALSFERAAELYGLAVRYSDDEAWRQDLLLQWADALVQAGRCVEAADVYVQAAEAADPQTAMRLRREAGVQLYLSGRVTRGRELLRPSVEKYKLELPEFERAALQEANAIHEQLVRSKFHFTPRSVSDIDPQRLADFDAVWGITQARFPFDPTLSLHFVLRCAKEALELGHVPRIIPALCNYYMIYESLVTAATGRPGYALTMAEKLSAEHAQPRERAYLAMARGVAHLYTGLYHPAALHLQRAEELFRTRCHGAVGEMRLCRQYLGYVLGALGQYRDYHLIEQWVREADRKQDTVGSVHLRLLAVLGALAEDDVERAQDYAYSTERWSESTLGITALLVRLSRARLALYTRDIELARKLRATVDFTDATAVVPAWRAEALLQRVRVLLFQGNLSSDETVLTEAEGCLQHMEDLRILHYADHVALCRAALLRLKGDMVGSMAALERILEEAEQTGDGAVILGCASVRRGQLMGQREGRRLMREGVQRLTALGIGKPSAFLRVCSPGFPDLDENQLGQS